MAAKVTEDKFGEAMRPFGGTVLQTSMSDADEDLDDATAVNIL